MGERQTRREQALQLAKDARQALFEEKKSITNILLQCKTICSYLGISDENKWIDLELDGYYDDTHLTVKQINEYVPPYRVVNLIYFDTNNNPLLLPNKILSVFSHHGIQRPISELESTDNEFTILGSGLIDGLNEFIRTKASGHYLPEVFKAVIPSNEIRKIIIGVRKRIGEFLNKGILEMEYGEIPEQLFENIRKEVDSRFVATCPNAIEKLKVAYERLAGSQNPEDWSHVATSCRRIIKDIADVLFPPQTKPIVGADGKEHRLDDSAYINRIITGLRMHASESEISFVDSMISYVDKFLHEIQRYASKGDHAVFAKTDAVRCVVYTYLLLGDILHYYYDENKANDND